MSMPVVHSPARRASVPARRAYSYARMGALWIPKRERLECIGGVGGGGFAPRGMGMANEWAPTNLPNLVASWDIRFPGSFTLGGGSVINNWATSYGLGYFFGPAGTTPTLGTNNWTNSRGQSYGAPIFDGVTDELICSNLVGGLSLPDRCMGGNAQPGTVIVVAQLLSATGNRFIWTFSATAVGSSGQQIGVLGRWPTPDWAATKHDDAGTIIATTLTGPDNNKNVFASALSATTMDQYVGVATQSVSITTVGQCSLNRMELGARAGTNYGQMIIASIDVYSDYKSSTDIALARAGRSGHFL